MSKCFLILSVALVLFAACSPRESDRVAYTSLWASTDQANPGLTYLQPTDDGNYFQSKVFAANRRRLQQDALNDALKSQMKSFGVQQNLAGLIAVLTKPLRPPAETPEADLALSVWMLSTRNMLWTTLPGKKAEVHYGPAGETALLLSVDNKTSVTCYMEKRGVVAEYVYAVKSEE